MNEERVFNAIVGRFANLTDERTKLILEIDAAINRLQQEKKEAPSPRSNVTPPSSAMVEDTIVNRLNGLIACLESSNIDLQHLCEKLNRLV